jgi:hypothetical protein
MHVVELDEVHYDLEVDGELVRRQLARTIWEDRGWATVAIRFVERDKHGAWKEPKVALLRFRRIHDVWKKDAAITIAADTAGELAAWLSATA